MTVGTRELPYPSNLEGAVAVLQRDVADLRSRDDRHAGRMNELERDRVRPLERSVDQLAGVPAQIEELRDEMRSEMKELRDKASATADTLQTVVSERSGSGKLINRAVAIIVAIAAVGGLVIQTVLAIHGGTG